MSKTLRTAAIVVGAVALVATGVGAAAGAGLIGTTVAGTATVAGIAASTITAVGAIAGAVGGLLSFAAAATAKKPGVTTSGNQSRFQTSLDQGLPWAIGSTATAGIPVHDITFDASGSSNNAFQTFFGVWSADRIHRVVRTLIDRQEVTFALNPVSPSVPDEAVGAFHDFMWMRWQKGAQPEPAALAATGFAPFPAGWTASHKLSGKAAFSWTLKFDPKGSVYPGGVIPPKMDELEGAEAWDPRLDSTYPGGSGPQRRDDPATWGFTENPFLLGLKWARGIWANGRRVMGIGMALAAISVPSAVYAANVADANGWKVGGVVYSTDPKWDVLKKICAAGGGRPMKVGGMLHFQVEAPRVSLATVTAGDIMGKPTIPGGTRTLDRINGVIPKFRSPDHNWQLVDAKKVVVDAFVAADGKPRTRALTWELVQSAAQVAQLATYDICNSREIEGIILPLRLRWCGYLPGDALTIAASVVGMDNQLAVIDQRSIEPSSAIVTLTLRTETTSKHDFALGKTTTPPPQPTLSTTDRTGLLQPGIDAAWSATRDDDPVNHPRPDDGAVNTRNPNAPIGDRTVKVMIDDIDRVNADLTIVRADLDITVPTLFDLARSVLTTDAVMQTKTTLLGKPVGTVVMEVRTVAASTVEDVKLLGARETGGTSFLLAMDTVHVDANTTLAQRFVQLEAYAAGQASAVSTTLNAALATERDARAQQIATVQTAFGVAISAAAQTITSAYSSADTALSQRIDQGKASFDGLVSQFSTYQTAQAGRDQASSTRIDQVNARLDGPAGIEAQTSFLMSAVVNAAGAATSKAVLSLKANGRVGGIVATNDGRALTLDLDFDAVRHFQPDGSLLYESGPNGEVFIPRARVTRLTGNAAVIPVRVSATSTVDGQGYSNWLTVLSTSFDLPEAGIVDVSGKFKMAYANDNTPWQYRVLVNGQVADTDGGLAGQDVVPISGDLDCPAGPVTVELQIGFDAPNRIARRRLVVRAYPNTQ